MKFPYLCHSIAEEGDVRFVTEQDVANWVLGRPEIFLDGDWQQICAAGFEHREADVVCRQLGYGAGTAGPFFDVLTNVAEGEEFSPIGVTMPGCSGTEATLLECGPESLGAPWETRRQSISGCRNSFSPGLTVACVAREEQGALDNQLPLRAAATASPLPHIQPNTLGVPFASVPQHRSNSC